MMKMWQINLGHVSRSSWWREIIQMSDGYMNMKARPHAAPEYLQNKSFLG